MDFEIIKNEKQFSKWFKKNYLNLGFSKIIRGDIGECPDFILLRNNREVKVELETISSNFLAHKHNPKNVDEVWCMVKDANLAIPIRVVNEVLYEGKQRVTLSIDSKIYRNFQDYCEKEGWIISRKLEIYMENLLKESKENKK